jgi:uncharacterized membrane protein (UPF0127 family)
MSLFRSVLLLLALATGAAAEPISLLPTENIIVDTKTGPQTFTVEIAADPKSQQRGLMYRSRMAADAGMLFDFHSPQYVSFWMENTFIPLDMLFVRKDGSIANIRENAVPFSRESIPSTDEVQLVIEINGGLSKTLGIAPGQKVHAAELHNMPPPPK